MVGPVRFELTTPSPPAKCATRLRYGPTWMPKIRQAFETVVIVGPSQDKDYPAPLEEISTESRKDVAKSRFSPISFI